MHRHLFVTTMTLTAFTLLLAACGEEPVAEETITTADAGPAETQQHEHSHDHDHAQAHEHDHAHHHDHDHHHHHAHANGDVPAPPSAGDPYPLAMCPVSGMELGSMGTPIVHEHDGRQVRFCCDQCIEPFEEAADERLAEIDEKIVEQQLTHYPLETCVVSGAELGSMGEPMNHVYGNRLVRFCCPGCDDDFEADPATHLAKIDEAVIEREKADYPTDKCVVSGEPLDEWGDPVDRVIANRLVRFCCNTCADDFHADPARYLAKRDEGRVPDEPTAAHDHDHDTDEGIDDDAHDHHDHHDH